MAKTFVKITADHGINGVVMPTVLHWEDGRQWPIEKVFDIRMATSLKAGGHGLRYTCQIANKQVYLFCDDSKWFIEK